MSSPFAVRRAALLLHVVLDGVELIEPERQRRSLLSDYEQQDRLDVVRPVEVGALAEGQLPWLARRDPILDSRGVHRQRLVDLDLDGRVVALCGRRTRQDFENRHDCCVSGVCTAQT